MDPVVKVKHFTYPFANDLPFTEEEDTDENITAESNDLVNNHIALLRDECECEGVDYHIETGTSIEQLISETLDTDLTFIDTRSDIIDQVLPHLHCPAYIVSEIPLPDRIVLLMDTSESAT